MKIFLKNILGLQKITSFISAILGFFEIIVFLFVSFTYLLAGLFTLKSIITVSLKNARSNLYFIKQLESEALILYFEPFPLTPKTKKNLHVLQQNTKRLTNQVIK